MDSADNFSFCVKDCTLSSIATGVRARSLIELRDRLVSIHPNSIYFHFWGGRLRTSFEHREYHNDFSSWVNRHLHDEILAERLELINPKEYSNMELLRAELIELIDDRLDEREIIPWVRTEEQFHFLQSKIIVFQTQHTLMHPRDLTLIVPHLTPSSLFYHFIDAARRTPHHSDDFTAWLMNYEEEHRELIREIQKIDPYLISLADLKDKFEQVIERYFAKMSLN